MSDQLTSRLSCETAKPQRGLVIEGGSPVPARMGKSWPCLG